MEMISYSEFGRLRLRDFCVDDLTESDSPDWEWMGGQWYYDGIGFTWFGCLDGMPGETGGVEVDLVGLPKRVWSQILKSLQLPLREGMTIGSIVGILGQPLKTESFVEDRKSYEFKVGLQNPYKVSCTVLVDGGLAFVSIIREDIASRIHDA